MFTPLVFGAIDRASTHLLRPTGFLKIAEVLEELGMDQEPQDTAGQGCSWSDSQLPANRIRPAAH